MQQSAKLRDKISIQDLLVQGIVGVNTSERYNRQNILINITMIHDVSTAARYDDVKHTINYSSVCKAVMAYTEDSHHYTLESLATGIAKICCMQFGVEEVVVKVDKPCVLALARAPALEICRTREFFLREKEREEEEIRILKENARKEEGVGGEKGASESVEKGVEGEGNHIKGIPHHKPKPHQAFIALGSNLGRRDVNIYNALKALQKHCTLIATSSLYETPPAYVLDQPPFLNGACKVETALTPEELLRELKDIEATHGRKEGGIRYGPRCIDLDILFYDDIHMHTETLIIPHPRIPERDFVLGPLFDIAPRHTHPVLKKTVAQLFQDLGTVALSRVLPVPQRDPVSQEGQSVLLPLGKKTYIMGILNATPDSFSDGGDNLEVDHAVSAAQKMIEAGVDILDIGGQSTRPGAPYVPAEQEIQRVVPIIKSLRENKDTAGVLISVDTFSSQVAEEAIKAGANMINDVSGGKIDERILLVALQYQVPIVLMHMRGTPTTMQDKENLKYPQGKLLEEVATFLKGRAEIAQRVGIPRWHIILDPGIGFAKKRKHNLQLLREHRKLHALLGESYTTLIGASRKRFIGDIVGQPDPKLRGWGTAATTTAAVAGGADIVRVHDVKEQKDVARVADAIFRV